MRVMIVAGTIAVPFLLLALQWTSLKMKLALDGLAILSAFLVAVTIGLVVEQSIASNTVFTTDVHKVLHNRLFLWGASYLGLYGIYRLLLNVFKEFRTA